jgi:RNA polymerase-binding transcription factor DksA
MSDLVGVKTLLEERLQMLTVRAEDAEMELRSGHSADFEEYATEAEGDEVLEGLEGSAVAEIHQITAALGRIDDKSYGKCVTCGDEVGEKRLAALPHTPQCISCANKN